MGSKRRCAAKEIAVIMQRSRSSSNPSSLSRYGGIHETRRQIEMAIVGYINGFYHPRCRHSALGRRALSLSNARWLKRALGAARKRDRSNFCFSRWLSKRKGYSTLRPNRFALSIEFKSTFFHGRVSDIGARFQSGSRKNAQYYNAVRFINRKDCAPFAVAAVSFIGTFSEARLTRNTTVNLAANCDVILKFPSLQPEASFPNTRKTG